MPGLTRERAEQLRADAYTQYRAAKAEGLTDWAEAQKKRVAWLDAWLARQPSGEADAPAILPLNGRLGVGHDGSDSEPTRAG